MSVCLRATVLLSFTEFCPPGSGFSCGTPRYRHLRGSLEHASPGLSAPVLYSIRELSPWRLIDGDTPACWHLSQLLTLSNVCVVLLTLSNVCVGLCSGCSGSEAASLSVAVAPLVQQDRDSCLNPQRTYLLIACSSALHRIG